MVDEQQEMHLGRLLGNALRRFDARVLELMSKDEELPLKWGHYLGKGMVTAAQMHMVRHLPEQGARLTDLAMAAGMTKQAMKNLMDQCDAMGLVFREGVGRSGDKLVDATAGDQAVGVQQGCVDRREKWIRYTEQGRVWREAFYRAVQRAERECEQELGAEVLMVIRIGTEAYGHTHDRRNR